MLQTLTKSVVFAIGTGRCGTKFLSDMMEKEPDVASHHEKHPLNDTFHRYCKWYDLPIDHEGFLKIKEKGIISDLKEHRFSFESSAYLSLSIKELYDRFGAKFILLIRDPEKVVNSYFIKGWYENDIILDNPDKIPSVQESKYFHHFLGRTLPKGEEFIRWNNLTRIGKLAWYWNTLNNSVIHQFANLPETSKLIIKLEELNYEKYRLITEFIGFQTKIKPTVFNSIANTKPNSFKRKKSADSWTEQERVEFEKEVREMADYFQY